MDPQSGGVDEQVAKLIIYGVLQNYVCLHFWPNRCAINNSGQQEKFFPPLPLKIFPVSQFVQYFPPPGGVGKLREYNSL